MRLPNTINNTDIILLQGMVTVNINPSRSFAMSFILSKKKISHDYNEKIPVSELKKIAQSVYDNISRNGFIIDVSSDTGLFTIELAKLGGYRVVGIEKSQKNVTQAKTNVPIALQNVSFVCARTDALPFDDDIIDGVVSFFSFKNYREPEKMLKEIRRVLVTGGKLVIVDLDKNSTDDDLMRYVTASGHISRPYIKSKFQMLRKTAYSEEELKACLDKCGYKSCTVSARDGVLKAILTK
jgi:ubiquinone/menaquinone biosynthesis C-methylase UbiE